MNSKDDNGAVEIRIDETHNDILDYLKERGYTYNPSKRKGGDIATKVGLQVLANHYKVESIDVQVVQLTPEKGSAIMKCTVRGPRGTYTDFGSANPANLKRQVADYYVEMASTRAQNRALTRYIGLGLVTDDEMPDPDERYREEKAKALYDDDVLEARKNQKTKQRPNPQKTESANQITPQIVLEESAALKHFKALVQKNGFDLDKITNWLWKERGLELNSLPEPDLKGFYAFVESGPLFLKDKG